MKAELKAEIQRATTKVEPKLEIKNEPASDSEDEHPGPSLAPVQITIPKRKDEIEAEKIATEKKAFARKLAELYATMKKDESSSER